MAHATRHLGGIAVGLVLALGTLACSGPETSDRSPVAPSPGVPVVIISIDTVRADRLPIYGYEAGSTPAIDALRGDGVLFTRAYSHVPLTLPSHTSLFTGRLPNEHGVRDNFGNRVLKGDFEELFYLPRALSDAGYTTAGVVSSFVLRSGTGISQGFDFFDDAIEGDSREGQLQRAALDSLAVAEDWLATAPEESFFLFFHLYDPHMPYDAPEPYASRFESGYDAEIAYTDAAVGGLLDSLRERGVYDRALIILVSDHGEGLLDHGEEEHGIFLYRESLQVPLVVKLPGNALAGSTRTHPVGLIDVVPTVAEVAGLELDEGLAARSLFAEPLPERQIYAESIYPRTHFGWRELFSLIDERYQYIDAPRPELYDLIADPQQKNNLAMVERPTLTEFRRSLAAYDTTIDFSILEDEDDETRQRLAALGYIGTAPTEDESLQDPKDGIDAMVALRRGYAAYSAEAYEDAVEIFRQVIADQPRMVDAWELLGRSHARLGQRRQAVEAFKQALQLSRGNGKLLLETAVLLSEMGDYEAAREHAELATSLEPAAFQVLVQTGIREGDLQAARRDLARGYATGHQPLKLKKAEADLEVAAENWTRALSLVEEIEAELDGVKNRDALRGLHFVKGRALMQLDRYAEAERAFIQEIELNPRSLAPYTHLALLYAVAGDGARIGAILKRMVDTNPNPLAYADAARTLRFIGDPRSAAGVLREGLAKWPDSEELRAVAAGA